MYICMCVNVYVHLHSCTRFYLFVVVVLKLEVVGEFKNRYFQPKSAPSFKQTIITFRKVDSLAGKASQITGDQHEEPVVLTNPNFSFKALQP